MTNFLQVTSFDPLIVSEPQGPQGPQGQPGPAGPSGGGVASIDGQAGAVDLSGKYASLTAAQTPADGGAQARANIDAASVEDAQGLAFVLSLLGLGG
jgi:hypothetical protein